MLLLLTLLPSLTVCCKPLSLLYLLLLLRRCTVATLLPPPRRHRKYGVCKRRDPHTTNEGRPPSACQTLVCYSFTVRTQRKHDYNRTRVFGHGLTIRTRPTGMPVPLAGGIRIGYIRHAVIPMERRAHAGVEGYRLDYTMCQPNALDQTAMCSR